MILRTLAAVQGLLQTQNLPLLQKTSWPTAPKPAIVEGFSEIPKGFTFSSYFKRLGTFLSLGGLSANH